MDSITIIAVTFILTPGVATIRISTTATVTFITTPISPKASSA